MSDFGWSKVNGGLKVPSDMKDQTYFFQDMDSRHKRIHISLIGEVSSLCNNSEFNDASCTQINEVTSSLKKKICKNCVRIVMGMSTDDTRDHAVSQAKKTVTRKSKNAAKHKRLEAHQRSLSKTKEDFMAALEKTGSSTITLPDEIGPEQHSLNESLAVTNQTLPTLRKAATMNLERVTNEWRKLPPNSNEEFTLMQEAHHLKHLIAAIDQIKAFPKRT